MGIPAGPERVSTAKQGRSGLGLEAQAAAVAAHEREMISARTKAALHAAKRRGAVLGSPAPGRVAAVGLSVICRKAAGTLRTSSRW
jgi:DNA invertase Pin-like site-specific DNA recombinase